MIGFWVGDAILELVAPEHLREEIGGDLRERFARTRRSRGAVAAYRGYAWDICTSALPLGVRKMACTSWAQWTGAVALGFAARSLMLVGMGVSYRLHHFSVWPGYAVLALFTSLFCVAARRPRIGALAVFYAALVVLQTLEEAFMHRGAAPLVASWTLRVFAVESLVIVGTVFVALPLRRLVLGLRMRAAKGAA